MELVRVRVRVWANPNPNPNPNPKTLTLTVSVSGASRVISKVRGGPPRASAREKAAASVASDVLACSPAQG